MEKIRIRRVERSDLDACYALERKCYTQEEAASRDFIHKRIEVYPDGFFVAEANGEIVGMINSGATHKRDITDEELKHLIGHVRNGRNSVVFSLAVDPEYRGKGIARQLMNTMVEVSRSKEKRSILLLCKDSLVEFYASLGFQNGGKSRSTYAGYTWYEMQYDLFARV